MDIGIRRKAHLHSLRLSVVERNWPKLKTLTIPTAFSLLWWNLGTNRVGINESPASSMPYAGHPCHVCTNFPLVRWQGYDNCRTGHMFQKMPLIIRRTRIPILGGHEPQPSADAGCPLAAAAPSEAYLQPRLSGQSPGPLWLPLGTCQQGKKITWRCQKNSRDAGGLTQKLQ